MKYLLDTDICIYTIKREPSALFSRLSQHQVGEVGISAITFSELSFGVANSGQPVQNQLALEAFVAPLEIMAYGPEIAPIYGQIRAHLRRSGRPIGSLDLLIAAHAVHLGSVLVTNNVREFSRVPHLTVENWTVG